MQVEFKQKLKDEDYINFGIRHYFLGIKKNISSPLLVRNQRWRVEAHAFVGL